MADRRHVRHHEYVEPQPAPTAEAPDPALECWMTPNAVVRLYPGTRQVFEWLSGGRRYDWSDCLDEVAWSHGLEFDELVERLRQAMRQAEAGGRE